MATLQSPGVSVSVIDQSQYVATGSSTVPFILLATASNKTNASGSGVATGTLDANASKLYQITSQRDLVNLFGTPTFHKTADGTPIHGHELNEYGLMAAYSVLGVTNLCYVLRSSIDTNSLFGSLVRPSSPHAEGTLWTNWVYPVHFSFGGYKYLSGSQFIAASLSVIQYPDQLDVSGFPNYSAPVGTVVFNPYQTADAPHTVSSYFKRTATEWVKLGSREWQKSSPTVTSVITPPVADTTFRLVYGYIDSVGGNVVKTDRTVSVPTGATATDYASLINGLGLVHISAAASGTTLYIYTSGDDKNTFVRVFATGFNSEVRYRTPQVYVGGTVPVTSIQNHVFSATVWLDVNSTNTNRHQPYISRMTNGSWVRQAVNNYGSDAAALAGLDKAFGGTNIKAGTLYQRVPLSTDSIVADYVSSPFTLYRRRVTGATIYTGTVVSPSVAIGATLRVAATVSRSANAPVFYTLTVPSPGGAVGVANAINAHTELTKQLDASVVGNQLVIKHNSGGTVYLDDNIGVNFASNGVINALGMRTAVGAIRGDFLRQTFTAVPTTTSGAGTGATVNVSRLPTSYGVSVLAAGTGYAIGDTVTVSGSSLGGAVENNLVLQVTSLGASGAVATYGIVSGTPIAPVYTVALSGWEQVSPEVNDQAPRVDPIDGTIWNYSATNEVDIMTNVNGIWKGYRNVFYGEDGLPLLDETGNNAGTPATDARGPIVADTAPKLQSTGAALVYGDLWLDSGEVNDYPVIYRWQKKSDGTDGWVLIDVTDQQSSSGMMFADIRWSNSGSTHTIDDALMPIASLVVSNYIDLDAPSAELYPHGILAFNMRRSGNNIKKYVVDYFNATDYPNVTLPLHQNTWITVSGKDAKGVGYFGRKAQRSAVVASLKAAISSNYSIREEDNFFNIIAAPGYPELQPDMVTLNNDRGNTAYIIGDTPFRLDDQATSLTEWATNAKLAETTGEDGMVTRDEYMGVYYPSAISTDLTGSPIVVPASHAMIRTMIRSDSNSYQWFAPAGIQRGSVDNVTNIGYIDKVSGEFIAVKNRVEIRDVLYINNINPFTFFNGVGIVNYGNKNSKDTASAMNRTNVSRLVAYLRDRVAIALRPFVFQMNDEFTRSQVREVVNSLLIDIQAKRGITEYFVECSDKNNTPDVIDRNELIVDLGISPNKSLEFVYIPIRIMNTGDI